MINGDPWGPVTIDPRATYDVLGEVYDERVRQDQKWGLQSYPDIYHFAGLDGAIRHNYASTAAAWKRTNDARAEAGRTTWDGVLLEEVFEALEHAGSDPVKFREELVQVAAVACLIIEDLGRRAA